MSTYQPMRGDAVEAWIKAFRDLVTRDGATRRNREACNTLDDLLYSHGLAADLGTPFDSDRPTGVVGECCGTRGCDAPDCPVAATTMTLTGGVS